jgi:hypothetical protein
MIETRYKIVADLFGVMWHIPSYPSGATYPIGIPVEVDDVYWLLPAWDPHTRKSEFKFGCPHH